MEYINRKIFTDRGIMREKDVVIGDKLYEYISSRFLTVIGYNALPVKRLFKGTFDDGRETIFTDRDIFYIGDRQKITPLEMESMVTIKKPILVHHNVVNFKSKILNPDIDFYAAGAFIGCGDTTDDKINILTKKASKINDYVKQMYGYEASIIKEDRIYYTHPYDGHYITYNEFFDSLDLELYLCSEPYKRVLFLRGVMDAIYVKDNSPDYINFIIPESKDYERMVYWIRQILFSMGVHNRLYEYEGKKRLTILGEFRDYPGLFYDDIKIKNMIYTDQVVYNKRSSIYKYKLIKVEEQEVPNDLFDINFLLNKHHAQYVSEDFLPRVSF